jgi:hypothetical protein
MDELGNVLSRGIGIQNKARFMQGLKRLEHWIVLAEQHLMIEFTVNPALHNDVDVAKVHHHTSVVQRSCFNVDLSFGVVPVQMPALTFVVQQAVSVTKMDLFGNFVNGRVSS